MGVSKVRSSAAACCWLLPLVVGFMMASSEAYVFYAGGRDGWVVDPTESYNHWAERNRFQVNDTIVFTYDEAANWVLLVTEADFDACSTRNPVRRLEAAGAGGSAFRFDRSGPFFFISGDEDRCQKGQKLYIIVMAPQPAPAPGYPQEVEALPPAGSSIPPFWASAPEYAQAPDIGGEVTSRDSSSSTAAPPPMAAAARLHDRIVVGAAVGVLGTLVFSAL